MGPRSDTMQKSNENAPFDGGAHNQPKPFKDGGFQIKRSILFIVCFMSLLILGCRAPEDPLTPEERAWLNDHDGKIIVNNEAGWPPIIDIDENGEPFGIVIDYQRLLEQKLQFKFKLDRLDPWDVFMERFQKGEIDVNNNLQKTPERSQYARFTEPYIDISNAIITRKENEKRLSLKNMGNMTVAVTKGFATHHYLTKNHPDLKLVPLPDDLTCLLETSSKNVDAAVVNLAVASYHIDKHGIANLHVAGQIGYTNTLSFASKKDLPVLHRILQKGLDQITDDERTAIYKKWVSLEILPFYQNRTFLIIASVSIIGVASILFIAFFWNRKLATLVSARTETLDRINKDLTAEIKDRKAVEQELFKSQNFMRATLDGLSSHIALLDQTGNILLVNKAWQDFAVNNGVSPDQVSVGSNYFTICDAAAGNDTDEDAETFKQGIDDVLSLKKDRFSMEYPCHSPDEKRWFVGHVTLFPDSGAPRVIVAHENITERKNAEYALFESEKRYRSIMESMEDALFICSSDHIIEYMNSAMIEKIGRNAVGETCYKALYDHVKPCSHCKDHMEAILPGQKEVYHVSHSPILNEDGTTSKLTVLRDITHIKTMEESLQQAQKMEAIGTLSGGIAHDFNNILFPIMGHTEMLLDAVTDDDPTKESLEQIYAASMRAKELVHQILTFSRQTRGEKKLISIQHIAKEVMKLIRNSIPTTIDIKNNIDNRCPPIHGDPTQIHQIIMNLTTNAYHAMEETGGILTVGLSAVELSESDIFDPEMKPGTYACLSVQDTGIGIPDTIRQQIFTPFFTTKREGKGTGMGLSVVHGIVKSSGGGIHLYSEPGKGTLFKIYLPVATSYVEIEERREKKRMKRGNERILLVDDERPIISMEEQMLSKMGYQVTSRTNSLEALEAFKARPDQFDLVITDMTMPKLPGDRFAKELLKIRPDIPIIVCTGFSENISENKAKKIGIKGLLLKPVVMSALSDKIREVIDN